MINCSERFSKSKKLLLFYYSIQTESELLYKEYFLCLILIYFHNGFFFL
jgi:hypothetical protein